MSANNPHTAFGAPGGESRWTHSNKEGLGTAYHTSCHLWFTLSHGIVDEIYYPTIDQPNTRDFQLLISDGESFCHEEKRHLPHRVEYPEKNSLFYRLTNSDPAGRYRIIIRASFHLLFMGLQGPQGSTMRRAAQQPVE